MTNPRLQSVMLASLAIICILILELIALAMGHNGLCLSVSVASIAGIAGYSLPRLPWH